MVETITPVVHGGRRRWAAAVTLHALAATIAAAAFGGALGWLGGVLGAPFGRAGTVLVVVAAAAYAAAALARLAVPIPALRRQVPDWWRTYFPPLVTATLYGAGLGIGFFTFLATGALVVVALAAFLGGSAWEGALVVGAFGAARGLTPLVAARVGTIEEGGVLVGRLAARSDGLRRTAVGLSLAAVAVAAMLGWDESPDAPPCPTPPGSRVRRWPITFAWAAIAKLAAPARWRRAIARLELPTWIGARAALGVPALEAVVPALALAGYPRAAAVWAAVLLLVFAIRPRPAPGAPFGLGGLWMLRREPGASGRRAAPAHRRPRGARWARVAGTGAASTARVAGHTRTRRPAPRGARIDGARPCRDPGPRGPTVAPR